MTRQQTLAEAIRISRTAVLRYSKGFTDDNRTAQAPHLPNHFAWTLGHLALTLHRTAERLDGKPLPESDFLTADGRGGGGERFDTESVSFGSVPIADPTAYPSSARCQAAFDHAIERCASAFEHASDSQLETAAKMGNMEMPIWTLAIRMVAHNGAHAGQLADMRRALAMPSIFA